MRMQDITKYTDRYVGKKVYSYLKEIGYSDIQLYHNITDTVNKSLDNSTIIILLSVFSLYHKINSKKKKKIISNLFHVMN